MLYIQVVPNVYNMIHTLNCIEEKHSVVLSSSNVNNITLRVQFFEEVWIFKKQV